MKCRPYILNETSWKTIRETDFQVAVLPWGATEAHNLHLPYGTDTLETQHIAAESARQAWESGAKVMVLPAIPFGVNTGQMDIPMTINMNPTTQAAVLTDVLESLTRQGIPKLVVLNGHGGNHFRQMIRELQPRFPEILIAVVDWFRILNHSDYFDAPGDHADEMETSSMLAIAPDQVLPLEEAGSGREFKFTMTALREKWAWTPREWKHASRDTGIGDPSLATADKGHRFLNDLTKKIASFLCDLAEADKNNLYEK